MGSWLRVAHHPSPSGLSDMTAMYHSTNRRQGVLVLHHTPPHREGQGRGGRGHKDSFTSLPPPPTWRCLQPLPGHGHQGGLHHVGVVQHCCSGPHGERGTQRSEKGLTAWIMQTRHQMGSTHTHVQWGGGRDVCRLGEME